METKIFLIRHGSVENPSDIAYGRLSVPLSEQGREEVKKLCRKLRESGVAFDKIYTSWVVRALQSAEIIREAFGIGVLEQRDELADVDVYELEGGPMQIIRDAEYREDRLAEMGFKIEPKSAVIKRVNSLVEEVLRSHPSECVAMVSHGDVTRLALWSQEYPERMPPKILRDKDYLAVAEAVILRFDGKHYLGHEFVRKEQSTVVEVDDIRRTEAY